jgi:TonB-dependent starch-binding outer membrane protein SusC
MNKLWLSHNIGLWIQKILRKMKLTVFLLCISTLASVASLGYAQSTKLTVVKENATVKNILDEIQNQSEFKFFFSSEVNVDRTTSINMQNKAVFDILDELFKGTNVKYAVFDKQIALVINSPGIPNENFVTTELQQPAVKGKVTDATGQALPGVTVVIKGTTQGTVTNSDGEYAVVNINPNSVLVFSFVGMRTQEVSVGNQTTINISMEEETIGIDEVVAIGYGTVKKSDLTGSVSSVKAEELQATPLLLLIKDWLAEQQV